MGKAITATSKVRMTNGEIKFGFFFAELPRWKDGNAMPAVRAFDQPIVHELDRLNGRIILRLDIGGAKRFRLHADH